MWNSQNPKHFNFYFITVVMSSVLMSCSSIDRIFEFNHTLKGSEWSQTGLSDEYGRPSLASGKHSISINVPSQFLREYCPQWGGPLIFPIIPLPRDCTKESQLIGVNITITILADSGWINLAEVQIKMPDGKTIYPQSTFVWGMPPGLRDTTMTNIVVCDTSKIITIWFLGNFLAADRLVLELGKVNTKSETLVLPPLIYQRELHWRFVPFLAISH